MQPSAGENHTEGLFILTIFCNDAGHVTVYCSLDSGPKIASINVPIFKVTLIKVIHEKKMKGALSLSLDTSTIL